MQRTNLYEDHSLTILLPLWDRDIYTRNWLETNYSKKYRFLIADGSSNSKNSDIVNSFCLHKDNIDYRRHPFDVSIPMYVEKMYKSANSINTPFVMTADNDDFLNFAGVDKCIDLLRLDPSVAFVSAPVRFVYRKNTGNLPVANAFQLLSYRQAFNDLDGLTGPQAISALTRFYRPVYYSIYRADVYKKVWATIYQLNLTNLYLIEIFHSLLSFALGKFRSLSTTHYIRLMNTVASSASLDISSYSKNPNSPVLFDKDYRRQLKSIISHLSSQYDMPVDFLHACFCEHYFATPPRSETNLTPLQQIILRIPKSSSLVPWSISSIRGFTTMFDL